MSAPTSDNGWERLFWKVFRRSRNPMALVDDHRVRVEVNPAWTRFWGVSREEAIGSSQDDAFDEQGQAELRRAWSDLLRNGSVIGEWRVRRPDGTAVRAQFAAYRERITGRDLVLVVTIGADLDLPRPSADGHPHQGLELTERQREVVQLIAMGLDTAEIAERLTLSPETVKSHVRSAMHRTGSHTRSQLVARAMAEGLIPV
jgi:PAS domain S-box-containing protein